MTEPNPSLCGACGSLRVRVAYVEDPTGSFTLHIWPFQLPEDANIDDGYAVSLHAWACPSCGGVALHAEPLETLPRPWVVGSICEDHEVLLGYDDPDAACPSCPGAPQAECYSCSEYDALPSPVPGDPPLEMSLTLCLSCLSVRPILRRPEGAAPIPPGERLAPPGLPLQHRRGCPGGEPYEIAAQSEAGVPLQLADSYGESAVDLRALACGGCGAAAFFTPPSADLADVLGSWEE